MERGRQILMCGCLLSTHYWGPSLQPRHVPWLGVELTTIWFTVALNALSHTSQSHPLKLYKYQYPFACIQNRNSYRKEKNISFYLVGFYKHLLNLWVLQLLKGGVEWDEMVYIQTGHLREMFVSLVLPLMCLWTRRLSFSCWWKCEFGGCFFKTDEIVIGRDRTIWIMGLKRGDNWWRKQEIWTYKKGIKGNDKFDQKQKT